ncbi:hypothetical protein ACFQUU_10790 [Herbaspirillum sp. GCM10030257]|uniref:hypothetical protein n=1 Tax=Herbaspirillum sp. GCM10030257 TaxID=3273393 RepID=UPI00360A1429
MARLAFFTSFLGVAVSPPLDEAPDVAVGELVPELVVALGLVDDVESVLVAPDAPADEVPLAPEVLDGFGALGGTDMDVPLPPAMPASLPVPAPVAPVAFCERTVDDGVVVLSAAPEDCARTSDDADAIRTNESALNLLVNVISTSY